MLYNTQPIHVPWYHSSIIFPCICPAQNPTFFRSSSFFVSEPFFFLFLYISITCNTMYSSLSSCMYSSSRLKSLHGAASRLLRSHLFLYSCAYSLLTLRTKKPCSIFVMFTYFVQTTFVCMIPSYVCTNRSVWSSALKWRTRGPILRLKKRSHRMGEGGGNGLPQCDTADVCACSRAKA